MANPPPIRTPDYSGLHTPDYSGLQAVDEPGLEVDAKRGLLYSSHPEVHHEPAAVAPYKVPDPAVDESEKHLVPVARPVPARFSRRCKIFTGAGIALLVIIAVVVGCVVGLVVVPGSKATTTPSDSSTTNPSSSNPNSDNTPNPSSNSTTRRSICRDRVCPQILASALHDTSLSLFARFRDNNIWTATTPITSLTPHWPIPPSSSPKQRTPWTPLGPAGPFLSQPTAQTWHPANSSLKIAVTALGDPDRGARLLQFDSATQTWTSEWRNLLGSLSSPVSLCASMNSSRLDLWGSAGGSVAHNFFRRGTADLFWAPDSSPDWQGSATFTGKNMVGRPAVVCRDGNSVYLHELVVYDEVGTMVHTRFSDKGGWARPFALDTVPGGVKFQGEPVVLDTAGGRLDFFGVGKDDGAVYHGFWTEGTGYSVLTGLGGKVESVPSVVATKDGQRIDMVALGAGDTLLHRVYQGGRWSDEWEDLGVFGDSAPLLVRLGTTPESVAVFVVDVMSELNQTLWTVSDEVSWKGLKWKGMGGDLTFSFFRTS
ncbi:hypothetical protein QBC47DRAFT_417235 [Echria macrotheca]|uniref:PLL-like beta propeller domain-containing protein n=1 Tax=Echria macrotheca TaxID=438768 RepID=A0AAJ0B6W2_9PEZI|nr:hypothetical protein QBC47DRAFT_417235 [Echria macrotheca]